eukprot:6460694-Amphidinium_carterae.1
MEPSSGTRGRGWTSPSVSRMIRSATQGFLLQLCSECFPKQSIHKWAPLEQVAPSPALLQPPGRLYAKHRFLLSAVLFLMPAIPAKGAGRLTGQ